MTAPAPKMSEGAHHSDPPEEADGPATVALPAAPSVADVLNGAADLIERDGWVQGMYRYEHSLCIVGAIDTAAGCFGTNMTVDAMRARSTVADFIEANPTAWNDKPGRTKAEVVVALRAAAERAA